MNIPYIPTNEILCRTKADLVLSIDNGIDIKIPNHQLTQAYYDYNNDGSMHVDDTYIELMIQPLLDDKYVHPFTTTQVFRD